MVRRGTKNPAQITNIDRFPAIENELILCAGKIETSIIRSVRSKHLISPRVRYNKLSKADLVAMLMAIARDNSAIAREMEYHLNVKKLDELLIANLSCAIDRATDFDERMLNYDFDRIS